MAFSDWATIPSALVGVVAAIVSIYFAIRSSRSAREVGTATFRIAEAAEKANEIRLQNIEVPTVAWSDANWRAGDLYSIKNVGTSPAYVFGLESNPPENANLMRVHTDLPDWVQPGESLEFSTIATFGGRADPLIVWGMSENQEDLVRTKRSAVKPRK